MAVISLCSATESVQDIKFATLSKAFLKTDGCLFARHICKCSMYPLELPDVWSAHFSITSYLTASRIILFLAIIVLISSIK